MADPFDQWKQERFQRLGEAAKRAGGEIAEAFDSLAAGPVQRFGEKVAELTRQVEQHAARMATAFAGLGQVVERGLKVALVAVTGTLYGLVQSGIRASAMGEVLSFQMDRLTRSIAGLFRPEVEALIKQVERLHDWLARLSDRQREQIAHWVEAAAVGLVVAAVLPRILAGVVALTRGFYELAKATTFLEIVTGVGALLPLIGLAVGAITALVVGTEGGRGALAGLAEAFAPLMEAVQGIWAALEPLIEALGSVLGPVVQAVATSFQFMAAVVQVVLAAMAPMLGVITVIAKVLGAVAGLVVKVASAFAGMASAVGEAVGEVGGAIGEVFSALGEAAAELIGLLGPVIEVVIELGKAIVNFVVAALKEVAALIRTVAQGLRDVFGVGKKEKAEGGRTEAAPRGGGMTDLSGLYARLAQSSATVTLGGGKSEAEKQTGFLEGIEEHTRRLAGRPGPRPATVGV